MVVTCSIPNCQSNSNDVMLFQIPPPTDKYYPLGIIWIALILNSYPNFPLANIYSQYVCSKHFKHQHFIPPDRLSLKSFAIPTVFKCRRRIYVDINRWQINNTATGMITVNDIISWFRNNNAADFVEVLSVPNTSCNTIESRSTTQNILNHTPPIENARLQEFSEQTAMTPSRPMRTRLISHAVAVK